MSNLNDPGSTKAQRRAKTRRRWTGYAALLFTLVALGFGYSAIAPTGNTAAVAEVADAETIALGQELYERSCVTCHGSNLQGVDGRGVPLIGVGQAATYFQVVTGRMPAKSNGAQMPRTIPVFNDVESDAIAAYVHSIGGGLALPEGNLRDDAALAKGAELYRLNCASCHNFTGKGGALSQGKYAPPLADATDKEIYAAMLAGPESMPAFSDAQLTPDEKRAIVSYVRGSVDSISPGGYGLGGFGPVSEGLIAFLVGMGAIVSFTLWSGSRK